MATEVQSTSPTARQLAREGDARRKADDERKKGAARTEERRARLMSEPVVALAPWLGVMAGELADAPTPIESCISLLRTAAATHGLINKLDAEMARPGHNPNVSAVSVDARQSRLLEIQSAAKSASEARYGKRAKAGQSEDGPAELSDEDRRREELHAIGREIGARRYGRK